MDDLEAFEELYKQSRERLAAQLTAFTGDGHEAIDCVQEAFIRAWYRWKTVSQYDDPEAWIRQVSYRIAIGGWRHRRRLILRAEVPRAQVEGSALDVIEALGCLNVAQRRAIVLHHIGGLSVQEVADELESPVGTVKSWLARGRMRLADLLDIDEEVQSGY